jgi:DNA-directed RNA polymerase subunit K/omega
MGAAMNARRSTQYISQERMRDVAENIYEAVMITALEARRINLHNKMLGTQEDRAEKVTTIALDRLLGDELNYDYQSAGNDEAEE